MGRVFYGGMKRRVKAEERKGKGREGEEKDSYSKDSTGLIISKMCMASRGIIGR